MPSKSARIVDAEIQYIAPEMVLRSSAFAAGGVCVSVDVFVTSDVAIADTTIEVESIVLTGRVMVTGISDSVSVSADGGGGGEMVVPSTMLVTVMIAVVDTSIPVEVIRLVIRKDVVVVKVSSHWSWLLPVMQLRNDLKVLPRPSWHFDNRCWLPGTVGMKGMLS